MDWTAGYTSDIEYTAGMYKEQSPVHLNLVCALNGIEAPPLDRPYTYFELGFGRGLTANVLAASHPNGSFYAADFNPTHVAGARALADAAGLDNLTLLENSFEELAQGKAGALPQFDYISLHGIYSWVTAENRSHIVAFIGRYLKPGGVVYLSYNAMPGWAAMFPLQRLLVEYADAHPGSSSMQIDGASAFIERMRGANSVFLNTNPSLAPRLDVLKSGNRQYLVHEYMHKHWQPLYHADVARDLAQAKLDFCGSANLPFVFPQLYITPERQALLASVAEPALRETVTDYLLNTGFRKDVFVRGARKMNELRRGEVLGQFSATLLVPRKDVTLTMTTPLGKLEGKPELYDPVCDVLADGPQTLNGLQARLLEHGITGGSMLQSLVLLASSEQVAIYPTSHVNAQGAVANAQRMNRVLASYVRYSEDYRALVSPLLGNGVQATVFDRLVYGILTEPGMAQPVDVEAVLVKVWQAMSAMGRKMQVKGVTLDSDADNLAALRPHVENIVNDKLPLWRQWQML